VSALPAKVLLATDGSEDAARAAGDLCAKTGAELHVVHAWRLPAATPHPAPPYLSEPVVDALERGARRLLEREVGRVRLGSVSTNVLRAARGRSWSTRSAVIEASFVTFERCSLSMAVM
jgi:hypothetical protein